MLNVSAPILKKNASFFCICIMMCVGLTTFGQALTAPQGFNYQGRVNDAFGQAMPLHTVNFRFSILNGTSTGAVVYRETQTVTTNEMGIFTVVIGGGDIVAGDFSAIEWGRGSKYLQVELDVNGGTNYSSMGAAELLSVPYALFSATSAKAVTVDSPAVQAEVVNEADFNTTGTLAVITATDTIRSQTKVWTINGNSGAGSSAFIGTTDNTDVVVKRNGMEALRVGSGNTVTTTGNVGMGGVAPLTTADINGALAVRNTPVNVWGNTTVPVGNKSYITLNSSVNASSAKITLGNGLVKGQLLMIEAGGSGGVRFQNGTSYNTFLSSGNLDLDTKEMATFLWNGNIWLLVSTSGN